MLDVAFSPFALVVGLSSGGDDMTALKLTRETLIGLDRVLRVYLEGETGTDVVGPVPPLAVRVLDERSRRG